MINDCMIAFNSLYSVFKKAFFMNHDWNEEVEDLMVINVISQLMQDYPTSAMKRHCKRSNCECQLCDLWISG
jgi:hypothetical protein